MIILILFSGRLKILRRIYSRSRYPYAWRSIVRTLLLNPSMAALVRFPKCQQAYLWCRVTGCGPSLAAFHFAPSRSREVAELLLGDYSGTVIRDSYTGYETLENCDVACCWAHARRYFVTAFDNGFGKAEEPLKLIRALYRIECEAKRKAEAEGTETALFQFLTWRFLCRQ